MADLYANFAALDAARQEGVDFRLLVRAPAGSRLAHIAVHGGGIEPGTLEAADHLAGSAHRFYAFDSMLADGVQDLHLTETVFDEPKALEVVAASDYVVSWLGATGTDPVTYIGGLDDDTAERLGDSLERAGFVVQALADTAVGDSPSNICNRGARGMGVHLELTQALLESFFEDSTRTGRESGVRTQVFYDYMLAVQSALNGLDVPGLPQDVAWGDRVAQPVNRSAALSGDFGIPALAPLSIDGMPLESVNDALRLSSATARQVDGGEERFWSGPQRHNGDPVREVFEFALTSERPVNRLSFCLARFPQRAWVQWRDRDGAWRPLYQARTSTPVAISVMDSIPAVIPAGVPDGLKAHPQHFGTGHWMQQMVDVEPVTASRFRIVMTRLPSSAAPRGLDGQPVAYSLGVKDAAVSYRVATRADLPWLPQADAEHTQPVAGSEDVLGSQVDYLVRSSRAANLTPPSRGVWRCAPQPVPNAVVSLYLDVRGGDGSAQVLDRLYLEPLTSGPALNLYYSEGGAPPERFAPVDTALAMPLVRASAERPVADGSGVLFEHSRSYLDLDNRAVHFDPDDAFLLAMVVNPQFDSLNEGSFTVLDNGVLAVWIEQGSVKVRLAERTVELEPVQFGVNATVEIAVAYDGSTLTVRTPQARVALPEVYVPEGPPPVTLRLGGPLDGEGGALRIRSLFLAQGRAGDIAGIEAYWADPASYALTPGYGADPARHTCANALLRMDPSLITPGVDSVCPWGLIGGPAVDYEAMSWTPVPGDFTLRKGLVKFRPVKARHLKLEFTNLVPVPVTPSQAAPTVEVKLFPGDTSQGVSTVAQPSQSVSGAVPVGAAVAVEQGMPYTYADAARIGASVASAGPYLPTEALYAPDPVDAQRLRRSGQMFPYLPLPGTRAPRFTSTGRHRYHTVHLEMDAKVAYTVAVRQVLAFLSDPVAQKDTEQYVELFHDTSFLSGYNPGDAEGWHHDGRVMSICNVPAWTGARLSSVTYVSRRRVVGVQFAAQTSAPAQLVKDPDFDDPSLRYWRPVGDASIETSDRLISSIGRMAQVTRGHALSSWGALERQFATWGDIEESNPLDDRPLWWEVENATSEADFGGIESLLPVTPAPGGRLYAAARVLTDGPLAQPLRLQLVNGDGRVLAEAEKAVTAAQAVEWYVGATVRTSAPGGAATWASVADDGAGGTRSWAQMEALGAWGDVALDWGLDDVHDVRVRVIQPGEAGTGRWLMDSLAVFNDPLVWEISRDGGRAWHEMVGIRNNPRGVFTFPDLDPDDRTGGTQLRWRVTGYAQGTTVSSVVLRPWYASLSGSVPYMDTLQASGASSSLADYYPPVDADPYFQGWQSPIPQEWWLAYQQWMKQRFPAAQPLPDITLPEAVAEGADEGAPPAPVRRVVPDAIVLNR